MFQADVKTEGNQGEVIEHASMDWKNTLADNNLAGLGVLQT